MEAIAHDAIVAQMLAALGMLRQVVASFPEESWLKGAPNRSWRIAYHALYFTDLYLSPGEDLLEPWEKHRVGAERFSGGDVEPYTVSEVLTYCDLLRSQVGSRVRAQELGRPSGFSWLQMTRLEAHLYNLRHLAHHGGQLADRLRGESGTGVTWVRRGE